MGLVPGSLTGKYRVPLKGFGVIYVYVYIYICSSFHGAWGDIRFRVVVLIR